MSVLGGLSASNIFNAAQRNFQAKAQAAWKGLTASTSSQEDGAASRSATSGLAAIVDPETREKILKLQQQAEALKQRLSAGGESAKEAAARKAAEAKEKLKMLKMQAQLAAASGDKKAAARIAKEAAQLAKELGQAVRDYGADSGGINTSMAGKTEVAAAAIPAGSAAPAGVPADQPTADAQAVAQQAARTAAGAGDITADGGEDASNPQQGDGVGAEQTAAGNMTESDKANAVEAGEAGGADGEKPAEAWNERRAAMMRDFAAQRAQSDFADGVRDKMNQLRTIIDQMKRLAEKDGAPGTKARMEQVERDISEGEQALAEATAATLSPFMQTTGAAVPPQGSLVQLTV